MALFHNYVYDLNYAHRAKSLQLKRRHRPAIIVYATKERRSSPGSEQKGIWHYCPHSEAKVTMLNRRLWIPTITLPADRTNAATDCQGWSRGGFARAPGLERTCLARKSQATQLLPTLLPIIRDIAAGLPNQTRVLLPSLLILAQGRCCGQVEVKQCCSTWMRRGRSLSISRSCRIAPVLVPKSPVRAARRR